MRGTKRGTWPRRAPGQRNDFKKIGILNSYVVSSKQKRPAKIMAPTAPPRLSVDRISGKKINNDAQQVRK
jgi:hypothetical protein